MNYIYLDHYAATPMLPEVFDGMRPFLSDQYGNASSFHRLGLQARSAIDVARTQIASLIGAESPETVIFTSSGTEAINLAVKGTAFAAKKQGNHLVVSATEHPAVLQSVEWLEQLGFKCTRVPVNQEGLIEVRALQEAVTDHTIMVAVHHANHEIGTIEPIAELGEWCRLRGVTFFVDATASGGWLPIDVQRAGIGLMALAPHRFYGPKGVGIVYRQRRVRLNTMMHGGVQEEGRRAGTENVAGIVGAGIAADLARRDLEPRKDHVSLLQERLWAALQQRVPAMRLNGPAPGAGRLPNNLNVSVASVDGEAMVLRCDLKGAAIASGPSCLGRSTKFSHVLKAIGLEQCWARGSVMFSLGLNNNLEQIDRFVDVFADAVSHLRALSPEWQAQAQIDCPSVKIDTRK
jgi:cysteine desulfurase